MVEADEAKVTDPRDNKIVIRPWPKIIFLYPSFIAALVAGVWQLLVGGESVDPATFERAQQTVGLLFFAVFSINLLVISFEFSRIKTVAILFFVVALVSFGLYLSTKYEVLAFLRTLLLGLELEASTSFYFTLAGYFSLVYAVVFVMTRWNYWVIRHNEIIHYTGFLGDIKRYPSPNLRMTKTIDDVFEFLLLGSGRIKLFPASEREAIILENVLGVNRIERSVKELLSTLSVKISQHSHDAPAHHYEEEH